MKYGRVYIEGGFRPAIVKEGRLWSRVVYNKGSYIKCKRVRGDVKCQSITGITLKQMARQFSRKKNCLGINMTIMKTARPVLKEARS